MPGKVDLGFGVQVEGMDELQATLDRFSKDGAKKAITKALRAGARIMQAEIESRTPVLDPKNSGKTSLPPGALQHDIHIGQVKFSADNLHASVTIGPGWATEFIAMLVEYGHVSPPPHEGSNHRAGPQRMVPAHPFLRPAWETAQNPAGELIQKTLEDAMQEALEGDGSVTDTTTEKAS